MDKLFQATMEGDALYIASSLFICIVEKRLRDDYKDQWRQQRDRLLAEYGAYSLSSMDATALNELLMNDIGFGNEWYYCDQVRLFRNEVAHIKNDAKTDIVKMEATWRKMCGFLVNLKSKGEVYSYSQNLQACIDNFLNGVPSVVDKNDKVYLNQNVQKAIRNKDIEEANQLLKILVTEHNEASAMMDYSYLYRTGFFTNGVPDFEQSIYWAERALSTASKSNVDVIIDRIKNARQVYENAQNGVVKDILDVIKLHIDGIWLPKDWNTIIAHYNNLQSMGILRTEDALWELVEKGVRDASMAVSARYMEEHGLSKTAHDRMEQILCKMNEFQKNILLEELEKCVPNDAIVLSAKVLLNRDKKSKEGLGLLEKYVKIVTDASRSRARNDFRFTYACKTLAVAADKSIIKMHYLAQWAWYNGDEESNQIFSKNMKKIVDFIISADYICELENYEIVRMYCQDKNSFYDVTRQFWGQYKKYVRRLSENNENVRKFFGERDTQWPYSEYFKAVGPNPDIEIEKLIEEKKAGYARIGRLGYQERCDRTVKSIFDLLQNAPVALVPKNLQEVSEKIEEIKIYLYKLSEALKWAEVLRDENNVYETKDLTEALQDSIAEIHVYQEKYRNFFSEVQKKEKDLILAAEASKKRKRLLKKLSVAGLFVAACLAVTFGIRTVAISSMKSGNYIGAYKILDKLAIIPLYEQTRIDCLAEIREELVEKGFRSEYFSSDGELVDLAEEKFVKKEEVSVYVNEDGTITVSDGSIDSAFYSKWKNIVKAISPDTGMVIALDANGNVYKICNGSWNWSDTKYAMQMYQNIPERAKDLIVVEGEFDTYWFIEREDGSYYQILVDFNNYGLAGNAIPVADVAYIHASETANYYVLNNGDCVTFGTEIRFRCEGTIDTIYDTSVMKDVEENYYYSSYEDNGVLIMEEISVKELPSTPKMITYDGSVMVTVVNNELYKWNPNTGWQYLYDNVSNLAIVDYRLVAVLLDGRFLPVQEMGKMEIDGKEIWEPGICVDGTAYYSEDNWYDGNDFLFDDCDVYEPISVYSSEVRNILDR